MSVWKAYLQFGEEEYLTMFAEMYAAAMRHLRPGDPGWAARGWLAEVDMHTGAVTRPWISSLSAFWPGLQALIGVRLDTCGKIESSASGRLAKVDMQKALLHNSKSHPFLASAGGIGMPS